MHLKLTLLKYKYYTFFFDQILYFKKKDDECSFLLTEKIYFNLKNKTKQNKTKQNKTELIYNY